MLHASEQRVYFLNFVSNNEIIVTDVVMIVIYIYNF